MGGRAKSHCNCKETPKSIRFYSFDDGLARSVDQNTVDLTSKLVSGEFRSPHVADDLTRGPLTRMLVLGNK